MKLKHVESPLSKRMLDIVVSLMIAVLLAPVAVIIICAMFLEAFFVKESRGPFFYTEIRISGGKPIAFRKFRLFKQSVIDEARKKYEVVMSKHLEGKRENFTHTGYLLNRVYMDEIPQLWSVLVGDLSFVGPRPTNPLETKLKRDRGDHTKDLIVGGLTGPYQSVKGMGFDQETVDMEYIEFVRTHSGFQVLCKDLSIILKTVRIIFRAQGI